MFIVCVVLFVKYPYLIYKICFIEYNKLNVTFQSNTFISITNYDGNNWNGKLKL